MSSRTRERIPESIRWPLIWTVSVEVTASGYGHSAPRLSEHGAVVPAVVGVRTLHGGHQVPEAADEPGQQEQVHQRRQRDAEHHADEHQRRYAEQSEPGRTPPSAG